jgi:hypothetical protein
MDETITITLTKEEAEVVDNYIFRKMGRLEEVHLEESFCYPRLCSAHRKIQKELKKFE